MMGDKTSSAVHAETICATCGHVAGAGEAGRFCPIDGRALIPRDVAERYPDDAFLGRILLGRYAVVDRIEDRGEGRRYRAIQRPGNHQVCVEVLDVSQHSDVPKLRTRFMNRAKLVGRLTHTSLVKVADYWVEADESQFLVVSELVEGMTLRLLLDREGPLSAERVINLIEPVLGALTEAHELDIPHGYLRPEVLLIGTTDIELRVLDFGLSDAVRTDPGGQSRPRPEADLTAIGRLLYEMLTGLVPVDGDAPTDEDTLRMPPVLNVPRSVQRVVARAVVGQNPFETAKDLAQALREALTAPLDEPTPAPTDELLEGPPAERSTPADELKIELAPKDEIPPIVLSVPPDELTPEVTPPPKIVEPPVAEVAQPAVSGEPALSELDSAPTPATADDLETFPTESNDEDFELPARRGWLFMVVILAIIAGAVFWYLQRTSKPQPDNHSATQVASTPTQPMAKSVTLIAKPDPAIDHGMPVVDQGNLRDQQVDANAAEDQGTRKAIVKVRAKRAKKMPPAVEAPKAERPDQLDRAAFMAVIGPMRARMTACQPIGPAGKVEIGVRIQPSGRVSQVTIDSPLVKSKRVQQCMRDLVLGLAFPEFQGPAAQHTVKCRVGARKKDTDSPDYSIRPIKLSKAQIMSVVRQHSRTMLGCKASVNDTGEIKVTLVIKPDGKVDATRVTASTLQHPATARCVREKVRGFQFPQFKGPPMKLTLPFRL